ncbi:sugar ABC transporter permease, partial [Candidatus Gracilibacteria bacterium]|nr:sugar ABC transporter permease [Candidatus Gracilibacteria bacterium]
GTRHSGWGIWGGLGLNMILYLAALQAVPVHLYEAATLDVPGRWQRFRHVTWPMITPTTFFITITSVIGSFQAFAQIHLLTRGNGPGAVGGGPHWATTTVIYYLWQQAFSYYRMGYAAALAWVLAVVILLITWLQFRMSRRWVFYNE